MKTSVETLLRQWAMLQKVPREPLAISAKHLGEHLADAGYKVSQRTVERDLVKLSVVFDLTTETRERVQHWFWPKHARVFDIPGMDPATALAFRLAWAHLGALLPPATLQLLAPHFERADEVLGASCSSLKSWQEKVRVITRGPELHAPEVKPDVQQAVYQGLLENRRLQVDYHPKAGGEIQSYEVSPHALVVREGVLYLVSTLWDYDNPVQLACHRMSTASVLDRPVRRPKDFDLDRYIRDQGEFAYPTGKGKIRLLALFDVGAAQHLYERPLSDDQVLKEQRDGRVLLTAKVLDTYELRWWLLGFGEQVEVMGPKGLRREFARTSAAMAARYAPSGSDAR